MEAQAAAFNLDTFMGNLYANIVNPLITFLFAAAILVFLWGVADFIRHGDSDEGREKGKQHMVWGIIGIFLMMAVFAVMCFISHVVGADGDIKSLIPTCR
jgi:hypothetical protein